MSKRPARRRSEGGHDGGWRLRLVTVANCEAADRSKKNIMLALASHALGRGTVHTRPESERASE